MWMICQDEFITGDPKLYRLEPKRRYFKCITSNDDNEVIVQGRYYGNSKKQAALKIIARLYNNYKNNYVPEKIIFGLLEATRNSNKKKYFYIGTRIVLDSSLEITKQEYENDEHIVPHYDCSYNVERIQDIDKYIKDNKDCNNPIFDDYDD